MSEEKILSKMEREIKQQQKIEKTNQENIQKRQQPSTQKKRTDPLRIPATVSLNNVPRQGATPHIIEKDLIARMNFYSEIFKGFKINLKVSNTSLNDVDVFELFSAISKSLDDNKQKLYFHSKK